MKYIYIYIINIFVSFLALYYEYSPPNQNEAVFHMGCSSTGRQQIQALLW